MAGNDRGEAEKKREKSELGSDYRMWVESVSLGYRSDSSLCLQTMNWEGAILFSILVLATPFRYSEAPAIKQFRPP